MNGFRAGRSSVLNMAIRSGERHLRESVVKSPHVPRVCYYPKPTMSTRPEGADKDDPPRIMIVYTIRMRDYHRRWDVDVLKHLHHFIANAPRLYQKVSVLIISTVGDADKKPTLESQRLKSLIRLNLPGEDVLWDIQETDQREDVYAHAADLLDREEYQGFIIGFFHPCIDSPVIARMLWSYTVENVREYIQRLRVLLASGHDNNHEKKKGGWCSYVFAGFMPTGDNRVWHDYFWSAAVSPSSPLGGKSRVESLFGFYLPSSNMSNAILDTCVFVPVSR